MLTTLGGLLVRRRRIVLALALLGAMTTTPIFLGVNDRLSFEAFQNPGSESHEGDRILEDELGHGTPNLVLVVTANSGSVDDPGVATTVDDLTGELTADGAVTDVVSYWSTGDASLRSEDGRHGLVLGRVLGDDGEVDDWVRDRTEDLVGTRDQTEVRLHGSANFFREISDVSVEDFERAEIFTVPVILFALLIVFGSVVAGSLPLLVAIIAVLGTGTVLAGMTLFTDVSTFSMTIVSALGLGLAVDYSLFIVSRFREEVALGRSTDAAVIRTMETAGRTVLFSALAVMVSLSSMVLIPLGFMRFIGLAAMLTTAMALVGSLIVLPATLASLGPKVNAGTLWTRSTRGDASHGVWFRIATLAMRRPLLVAASVIAVLIVAALPALHVELGLPDDRNFAAGSEIRETGDILREEFETLASMPLLVVLPGVDASTDGVQIAEHAVAISRLESVDAVSGPTGTYVDGAPVVVPDGALAGFSGPSVAYLSVANDALPVSEESERLIDAIRAMPHPFDRVLVTGEAAAALDLQRTMIGSFPLALGFIVLATFVILFLQFGSILVPLKAILLNCLSIGALMGALVWVFQDGHLSGVLDFTATGSLYINIPILIFALAFGLSMDYEVFLLSRIKEEYDRTGDNDLAIATGLDRCGRIVSAAAVLISLVFLTVGSLSSLRMMKAFGLGLAGVVLLDAFIIRGTLVPALMKLAGRANWWAPAPLRRIQERIGLSEVERAPATEPEPSDGALAPAGTPSAGR